MPLVYIGGDTSYLIIDLTLVIRGVGVGAAMMPAMAAAFAVLRPSEIHDASPQLNVIQRVGGSIGTELLGLPPLRGDAQRLSQAFGHLVADLARHAERGSTVQMSGTVEDGRVAVLVATAHGGVDVSSIQ